MKNQFLIFFALLFLSFAIPKQGFCVEIESMQIGTSSDGNGGIFVTMSITLSSNSSPGILVFEINREPKEVEFTANQTQATVTWHLEEGTYRPGNNYASCLACENGDCHRDGCYIVIGPN